MAIADQITDEMDGKDELTSNQRVETAVEYAGDDAVDIGDGEGPDKSKEALIIQRAAREYLRKCSAAIPNDKLKIGRDRLFKACRASANEVHAKYRKIYLGPVPHLLLCLEWIISTAQASKGTIKARRAQATLPLRQLSDLMLQQTQMT